MLERENNPSDSETQAQAPENPQVRWAFSKGTFVLDRSGLQVEYTKETTGTDTFGHKKVDKVTATRALSSDEEELGAAMRMLMRLTIVDDSDNIYLTQRQDLRKWALFYISEALRPFEMQAEQQYAKAQDFRVQLNYLKEEIAQKDQENGII